MIVPSHFDKIFSCDCDLSNPKIVENRLIVCVRNIGVISGHPLYQEPAQGGPCMFRTGHLIFEDVEASIREIYEYKISQRVNKFKPKRIIQDGPFPRPKRPTETFRFEGVLDMPPAWVQWTVMAGSFSLEVLD